MKISGLCIELGNSLNEVLIIFPTTPDFFVSTVFITIVLTKVGNLAPAFTLQNQDGEKVSLKDFKGKKNVVLYFYPRASTPGCTLQACGLTDIKSELEKRGYVALGVSFDPVAKIKKFHDKYELNFPLLSDEDHAIIDKYGCWQLKKFIGSTRKP